MNIPISVTSLARLPVQIASLAHGHNVLKGSVFSVTLNNDCPPAKEEFVDCRVAQVKQRQLSTFGLVKLMSIRAEDCG
jgi:hypothetical protein